MNEVYVMSPEAMETQLCVRVCFVFVREIKKEKKENVCSLEKEMNIRSAGQLRLRLRKKKNQ